MERGKKIEPNDRQQRWQCSKENKGDNKNEDAELKEEEERDEKMAKIRKYRIIQWKEEFEDFGKPSIVSSGCNLA